MICTLSLVRMFVAYPGSEAWGFWELFLYLHYVKAANCVFHL